ncbi:hypothetical protein [Brevundimonas sp.]|uniref:hypothetical protein n=1 Tax=Brevundimonas sp. TaxID=1871086 RepID=UPI001D4A7FDA|nr:hypothetical protein [Brevundimonas sp.]MBL0948685.1 hypothetical protein [Brevundimonas sp.]
MPSPKPSRIARYPALRYVGVMVACMLFGGIAGAFAAMAGSLAGLPVAVLALIVALGMAGVIWMCSWWWSGLDEAAREAHKWAWWWGSTFGIAVGGVILLTGTVVVDPAQARAALEASDPVDLVQGGALCVLLLQTVGYACAWVFWWARHR